MPRTILLGTSWKMNKTVREAVGYAEELPRLLDGAAGNGNIQVFVIPPFTAIEAVQRASAGRFWVGAQNMHWEDAGAFTGEISPPMLRDLGVEIVELGHSERRQYFSETDEAVRRKVSAALKHGLRPLVCVGEELRDRELGVEYETVTRQLRFAFGGLPPECAARLIVAYEPVWAIGHAGKSASPADVRAMIAHIRCVLSAIFGEGASARVIYGGAVDAGNCAELLTEGRTDGLFVGRAALEAEGFARIIAACADAMRPG
jgi:triosephosphate isomerase